ncbi:WXG100 family type VII secretion target [Actinomyces bowdenii]|uniref:WXG100 family type VII secretion target n=1 Tax=Actinomyces bowdenii TaxID=131109 RepID=A0A3P1UL75_9ACTO|nr:WXG100 family type VII secretion target [Actinomyces bowdenii]MBO3725481.1 WXG100 family type VII secretion target [Actinomyces bowdenii]RRD22684.1 WXG100 family type VII secretion target [Actinomyces bowdenii]
MTDTLATGADTLARARQVVSAHRAQQRAIAQRVQAAATDSQPGWKGQGAAAVAQVVAQWMQDSRRIDQALGVLEDGLGSTDKSYQATEEETAAAAQSIGSSTGGYHGLPS